MTLHNTTVLARKIVIWSTVSIGGIIVAVMLFQLGVIVKNLIFPPKVQPPAYTYEKLPPLVFPEDAVDKQFEYTINTVTGDLPPLTDRVNVYPITQPEPNFLNLNKVKEKVARIGFLTDMGSVIPEKPIGNENYEWEEDKGIKRKITVNIVTFDFHMESSYLSSLTVLDAKSLSDEADAIATARGFLETIALGPDDLALEKTSTPFNTLSYTTYPQLFSIKNSALVPTTSLSNAQVIRVDLYQKDMAYDLNTGIPDLRGTMKRQSINIPILYPRPPYSTMSFWIASNQNTIDVVAAKFVHQNIVIPSEGDPTYGIKTAEEAFEELKSGKGYIAAYSGTNNTIKITDVYVAYYLGETLQDYLMPIIVFEGDNGFFAYVSAIQNDWIK